MPFPKTRSPWRIKVSTHAGYILISLRTVRDYCYLDSCICRYATNKILYSDLWLMVTTVFSIYTYIYIYHLVWWIHCSITWTQRSNQPARRPIDLATPTRTHARSRLPPTRAPPRLPWTPTIPFASCPRNVATHVTEPPQKWGVRLSGSGSGDSQRSENAYKHTYEAFKIIILLKIKLLHFSLKIIMIRSRRFFKR
jgi:hypothetical protein